MTLMAIHWNTVATVLVVIAIILVVLMAVMYYYGKKLSRQQAEQQPIIDANTQDVSMLIIDKKRMRIKDAGLPQAVVDQTPKMMRRSKLPIVKAKVGPKIMTLIADDACFDLIPLKKEVKATVSGIYITKVAGVRGPLEKPEGKVSWRTKLKRKLAKTNKELNEEKKALDAEKAAKKASKKK